MDYIKAIYKEPAAAVKAIDDLIQKGYPAKQINLEMVHADDKYAMHHVAAGLNENILAISSVVFLWIGFIFSILVATNQLSLPGLGLNAAPLNPVLAPSFQPPLQPSSGIIYSGVVLGVIAGILFSVILSLLKYTLVKEGAPVNEDETTVILEAYSKNELVEIENSVDTYEADSVSIARDLKIAA